jgi:hypothetical protein
VSSEEHSDPEFEGSEEFGSFEDEEEIPPESIDAHEREALQQDLLDIRTLKSILSSRGIKGVVVFCPDCDDDHYLGWDLLAGNLQRILESGRPPVHEPAWQPDPDEYVTWDYARGFLDGYETYPEERTGGEQQRCGYCGRALPEGREWTYCPSCGENLAPVNLIRELREKGWSAKDISELLLRSGFDPPIFNQEWDES